MNSVSKNDAFAQAALNYLEAGWCPLPVQGKRLLVTGWTGGAPYQLPTSKHIFGWIHQFPKANIAVRMPPNVLGVDVDDYGIKRGAHTLQELESNLGPLPGCWISTSREGKSGIRFLRVPTGLAWPGKLGPGIETVHIHHRYAVVAPSIHPDTGELYRWIDPDGEVHFDDYFPGVEEL